MTKNSELTDIGLHPDNPIASKVISVRVEWKKVCDTRSIDKNTSHTFCISFFGSIYNELLRQCQVAIKPPTTSAPLEQKEDTDDVYYRFGGAAIATMLKTRYSKMQNPTCSNKDHVSLEITMLQKLSVHLPEEKTHIPEYLKCRDER